ncbi:signal peptidase I [Deinococcus multiflagellatus]|uniref:Signal peptidase I n=1 Tax=Deinococcus multiflagellatus TaxID=1656887 RepID=A0ABW1ZTE5_9DEIO
MAGQLRSLWKDLLRPLALALIVTQLIATLVSVSGLSMMPTLRDRERVFIPKYETWLHKAGLGTFARGDIIVFKPSRDVAAAAPRGPGRTAGWWTCRPSLIKRVVGLPGDRVRIQGVETFINGRKLDSRWATTYWQEQGCWDTQSDLANGTPPGAAPANPVTLTVPAGQYFVLGDNRTMSGREDSRLFGTVPLRDIAGRATAVVWPVTRKVNAQFDCAGKRVAALDGSTVRNWRLLQPPQSIVTFGAARPQWPHLRVPVTGQALTENRTQPEPAALLTLNSGRVGSHAGQASHRRG